MRFSIQQYTTQKRKPGTLLHSPMHDIALNSSARQSLAGGGRATCPHTGQLKFLFLFAFFLACAATDIANFDPRGAHWLGPWVFCCSRQVEKTQEGLFGYIAKNIPHMMLLYYIQLLSLLFKGREKRHRGLFYYMVVFGTVKGGILLWVILVPLLFKTYWYYQNISYSKTTVGVDAFMPRHAI